MVRCIFCKLFETHFAKYVKYCSTKSANSESFWRFISSAEKIVARSASRKRTSLYGPCTFTNVRLCMVHVHLQTYVSVWSMYIYKRASLYGPCTFTNVRLCMVHVHLQTYVSVWAMYIYKRTSLYGPCTFTNVRLCMGHVHLQTYVSVWAMYIYKRTSLYGPCTFTNVRLCMVHVHLQTYVSVWEETSLYHLKEGRVLSQNTHKKL